MLKINSSILEERKTKSNIKQISEHNIQVEINHISKYHY